MTDLVLVRPGAASVADLHWSENLPLGIGYLAASARRHGLRVAVVDGKFLKHRSIHETVEQIRAHRPLVVGISALTVEFPDAMRIAALLKDDPNPPAVVLGGAHANALPSESLAASEHLDYVIAGEGEDSLVTLVRALGTRGELPDIPGLHCRGAEGTIDARSPAIYNHDIRTLPFPAWDMFPRSKVYPVMTERGCPYECVFCSRNMTRTVRSRPVDHVMEEIRWLDRDFAPQAIHFEDETFGLNKERTYELLARLSEFNSNRGIRFKAQTRVDRVTAKMAAMMKTAGFEYVEIGVESGDAAVLAKSKKGFSLDQVESAIRVLASAGIKTWLNFIIGLPGETKQSVRRSIDLATRLNPNRLSVAIIVAYPGSEVFKWAVDGNNGYRRLTQNWARFDKYLAPSVELDGLSYRTMRRLQFQMYVETYLRNRRVGDLSRLLWKSRSFIRPFLQSIIRTKESS